MRRKCQNEKRRIRICLNWRKEKSALLISFFLFLVCLALRSNTIRMLLIILFQKANNFLYMWCPSALGNTECTAHLRTFKINQHTKFLPKHFGVRTTTCFQFMTTLNQISSEDDLLASLLAFSHLSQNRGARLLSIGPVYIALESPAQFSPKMILGFFRVCFTYTGIPKCVRSIA